MPASTVIPTPILYIKVVVIEKLVVLCLVGEISMTLFVVACIISEHPWKEIVWH